MRLRGVLTAHSIRARRFARERDQFQPVPHEPVLLVALQIHRAASAVFVPAKNISTASMAPIIPANFIAFLHLSPAQRMRQAMATKLPAAPQNICFLRCSAMRQPTPPNARRYPSALFEIIGLVLTQRALRKVWEGE